MQPKLNDVRRIARAEALSFSLPEPLFDLQLSWSKDYDGIFSGKSQIVTGIEGALDRARSTGRVLLTGAGGGAKTVIFRRLARKAANGGDVVVFVDLKRWTAKEYDEWSKLRMHNQRMDFLLLKFGQPLLGTAEIDLLPTSLTRIIFIDGLNEVRANTGADILDAADDFVRYGINTSVMISDRLVRRSLQNADRWALAAVLPLSEEEVARRVKAAAGRMEELNDSTRALLRSPYFLDSFLRNRGLRTTKAEELHNYFVRYALDENEIDRVAEAAFRLYGGATRTFSLATLTEIVGADTTAKLTTSRTVVVNGDLAYFDHHLKHDYLVSKFISADQQRWTADNFNVITFNASSFDTIVLAMEQMPDQDRADRFLRALYDWNIYGAGYALSDRRHDMVSPDMSIVVHAMFAERRWEIFVHTAKTAEDILNLIGTELSTRLLAARAQTDVLAIVRDQPGQAGWFGTWRNLFTAPPDTNATDEDLAHLRNPADSVMGWTSSNVLRRKNLSLDQQETVRQTLLQDQAPVVRWRAAHVLGRFPSQQNAAALLQSLIHDTREVRYGATRSLVEMAARSQRAFAEEILGRLAESAPQLAAFTNVVGEFQKTLIVKQDVAPAGWTKMVLPAVAAFQQATIKYKTREDWDRTIQSLIDFYGYD